ncbi:hsp70 nucleotide exchange factor fes1 [Gaertneriomyces sp. JEL0708]|nr:hsp70 nucleotide exchange factor fes1 [Gaertneriomyces sp. JEL0708]
MASVKVTPPLLGLKTWFASPAAGITRKLAGSAPVPRAATPKMSAKVCIKGGQLTAKTQFAASVPVFGQKRFYASAVRSVASDADCTQVPKDQDQYKVRSYDDTSSRNFAYFMIGTYSFIGAAVAKNIVTDYLVHFAASADVLAMAKVEVDMASVPEGKNVIIKWRGKPVFVRHRTADEIAEAESVALSELRDPETDADRVQKPEWLVMLGVCTHLGCVPIGEAGEYGGWFCPCHGSHYDISGRIRKGPAPLNLEIPQYELNETDGKIVIG